jgi:tetratricopeptide (TPR) repeat protein
MDVNIPNQLKEAVLSNNLTLFIGAGCSISLGFPSWKSLVEEILLELDEEFGSTSSTSFKNILKGVKDNTVTLFDVLNVIENNTSHGNIYKIKSKEIVNRKIDMYSKSLPATSDVHSLLWTVSSKIITTNYDKVLEQYIPRETLNPVIFENDNTFQALKSLSNDSQFLYKIHGDYQNPKNIILFESDYKEIYNDENSNQDILSSYFKDRTLLFIGFSLSDPFVNDLFIKIKKIYEGYTINKHYVLSTKNEDFSKFDIQTIKIEDWNTGLLTYLDILSKVKTKKELKLDIKNDELPKSEIGNIANLIENKIKKLKANPNEIELHKEIKDLQSKLNTLMYGDLNYMQQVDIPFRRADLQALFEKIYSSEKIDTQTYADIQRVRTDVDIYKWFDRSVIVSSITCSLIHFNKADEKKISLIVDFINDNEEKVWQKAIVGLFVALNHLGNKWLRFHSIKDKLQSLNHNIKIQEACLEIIQLFSLNLNNVSLIDENLFSNEYFKDNPFNYFFPYHDDQNPEYDKIFDTYKGNNLENFLENLKVAPIPDQIKYLICSDYKADSEEEATKEVPAGLYHLLDLNYIYYPFSVYVQELLSFYKLFPIFHHKKILESELKLTETHLKDYLLNEKQKYCALGFHFLKQKLWSQSIVNYKEAIHLDTNNIENYLYLARCYKENDDRNNEYEIRKQILSKECDNEENLYGLYDIYLYDRKEYAEALSIINRLIKNDDNNPDYYNSRAIVYKRLDDNTKALDDFTKSIELDSNEYSFYSNRAQVYSELCLYELSLAGYNKAIELNSSEAFLFYERAEVYYELLDYQKSLDDINTAISLKKDNASYYLSKSKFQLFLSQFVEAKLTLEKAEYLGCDKDIIYNYFANYYRLQANYKEAFECIDNAEKIKLDYKYLGTRAVIYSSLGDDENFYKFLEEALKEGAKASLLYPDIKNKYKHEQYFNDILLKYNQKIY